MDDNALSGLSAKIQCGKHPSWLIYGCPGAGKTTALLRIVNRILRQNPDAPNKDVENRNLFILHGIEPILVNDIRQAKNFALRTATNNRQKLIAIENAHNLGNSAAAALLKLLEEPPESTVIILTTSSLNALLPTIRSRCMKIFLRKPGNPVEIVCKKCPGASMRDVTNALTVANNSPGLAIKLLNHNLMRIYDLLKEAFFSNQISRLPLLANIAQNIGAEHAETFFAVFTHLFRNYFLIKSNEINSAQYYQILDEWQKNYCLISNAAKLNMSLQNTMIGLLK